ncbi:MAG: imidazolonepropionase [Burkholderiales bacterium]|nr:imidazolonepropionase [Burkholderiales bacterium]
MDFDCLLVNANALLDLNTALPTANCVIGITNGKISLITQIADWSQFQAKELIDLKGQLLTPGLVDCHTHLIHAGSRANEFKMRLDGASYAEIAAAGGGIKSTVKATNAASHAELFELAAARAKLLQRSGATTIEVKSGYGLSVEGELKMLQVARSLNEQLAIDIVPTFLGAHAVPAEYAGRSDDYVNLIIHEMLPAVKEQQLAEVVDGFCENIAFSPAQMERIFEQAQKMGFKLKLHAEQLSDQKGAKLAAQFHALSVDHLEYLDPQDVINLSLARTVAVLLPAAFYFLKETKLPPMAALREHKVPIAIASDMNPGTSPFMSLPLIMNMACVCFGLSVSEVWQGLTINAAKALGLDQSIGSIAVGKQADFALWDCTSPETVIYNSTGDLCRGIFKNGIFINS